MDDEWTFAVSSWDQLLSVIDRAGEIFLAGSHRFRLEVIQSVMQRGYPIRPGDSTPAPVITLTPLQGSALVRLLLGEQMHVEAVPIRLIWKARGTETIYLCSLEDNIEIEPVWAN